MVKNGEQSATEFVEDLRTIFSKLYLRREKLKDKLRAAPSKLQLKSLIDNFKLKCSKKESKIKKKISSDISDIIIRTKIINKLTKGLKILSPPDLKDSALNSFLNEMTDYNTHDKELKLEKLLKKLGKYIEKIPVPIVETPSLFAPIASTLSPLYPIVRAPTQNLLEGWPARLMIGSIESRFRPDFITNLTQAEKQRLSLMTTAGVIRFLVSGANCDDISYDHLSRFKVNLSASLFKSDALKYLGHRIYFDPLYMRAVRNIFLTHGLRIFFNHKEFPLRINFIKAENQCTIESWIFTSLKECGFNVSYGYENKSVFVTGTLTSEENAKRRGFIY